METWLIIHVLINKVTKCKKMSIKIGQLMENSERSLTAWVDEDIELYLWNEEDDAKNVRIIYSYDAFQK